MVEIEAMNRIKRADYFDKLNSSKDKPFIKVLTGLRRVGKSTHIAPLYRQIIGICIEQSQILKLNFELPKNFEINDYKSLSDYVLNWAKDKCGPL
jgi:predicted AAA+ superfamily ATPase